MATAKNRRTKKFSKGIHSNVASGLLQAVRAARPGGTSDDNKVKAWRAGANPWMTIPNPNTSETNKPYIRVKADKYFGGTFKDLKSRFKRPTEEAAN